jgi:hypothetical protein
MPRAKAPRPIGEADFKRRVAELLQAAAAETGDAKLIAWVGKLTTTSKQPAEKPPRGK